MLIKKQEIKRFRFIFPLRQAFIAGIVFLQLFILSGGHLFHNHAPDEACTAKCAVHRWIAANHADEVPTIIMLSPDYLIRIVFLKSIFVVSYHFLPSPLIRAPPVIA